jgi:hypothetical protein
MKTFEDKVEEMIDAVTKLTWNYTIFYVLVEKKETYIEVRAAHPEFCLNMFDSLFCGFCVTVDFLFDADKKGKKTSLSNLIKELPGPKLTIAKDLDNRIHGLNASLRKIGVLRNQALAHRSEAKTPQQVFAEANLTIGDMADIVRVARSIILELAEEVGGDRKAELEKQQFSETTLQAVSHDARQVMLALASR